MGWWHNDGRRGRIWSWGQNRGRRCATASDGVALEREVARAIADVDSVAASASLRDHPVLADDVPNTEVLAGKGEGDVSGGAGCELEFLEAAELADGGIEAIVWRELEIPIPEKLELGRKKIVENTLTAERLPFQSWFRCF